MAANVDAIALADKIDSLKSLINDVPYYAASSPKKLAKFEDWLNVGKALVLELTPKQKLDEALRWLAHAGTAAPHAATGIRSVKAQAPNAESAKRLKRIEGIDLSSVSKRRNELLAEIMAELKKPVVVAESARKGETRF